jgi:hypothetical protein
MVGVGITAECNGPYEVFLGISGPTEREWKTDDGEVKNRNFYRDEKIFIGPESRQSIADATLELSGKSSEWWPYYDKILTDATGRDISDWRVIKTVVRLFSEKQSLSEILTNKMVRLSKRIGELQIDAT